MLKPKIGWTPFLLIVAIMVVTTFLSACNANELANKFTTANNEAAIAQAVEATLTAVATDPGVTTRQGQATQLTEATTPTPATSRPVMQLPPPVPDWQSIASKPLAEKGSPDAPVLLIEYSDFQCPWCGRFFQQVMPQINPLIEAGDVRFVYKHFPVLGDASIITAQASECAGQLDDFWSLHDWLFENQSQWKGQSDVRTVVLDAAVNLGYDQEALSTCMDDPATMQAITQDYQETQKFGFRGTPSFMLNGRLIPGFLPWEQFGPLIAASKAEALGQALPSGYALAPTPLPPDTDFDPEEFAVAGDPEAPVTIVEFSDYQCPFCQRFFQETKPQLDKTYIATGKVRFVYKDFPLDNIHPQARVAALAAECAGAQDAYWGMHNRLFQGKDEWADQAQAVEVLQQYASELGLDTVSFNDCMDNQSYAAEIQADFEEGQRAGVSGTPTFYVNGQPLVGAQPFAAFVQLIEAELSK
ncbi:MAG TPA: thioredoxin domain-containing protein [Caldilineaceae bacterium]|nr:thioredoxin domain-containing protein [Caldilineaceae bacterium]